MGELMGVVLALCFIYFRCFIEVFTIPRGVLIHVKEYNVLVKAIIVSELELILISISIY